MAQLKSLCLVLSGLKIPKLPRAYWPNLILVNSCSCSHINFVQTAVEEKLILCCVLVSPLEAGLEHLMGFYAGTQQPYGQPTAFKYKSPCMVKLGGVFQATKTTYELVCV